MLQHAAQVIRIVKMREGAAVLRVVRASGVNTAAKKKLVNFYEKSLYFCGVPWHSASLCCRSSLHRRRREEHSVAAAVVKAERQKVLFLRNAFERAFYACSSSSIPHLSSTYGAQLHALCAKLRDIDTHGYVFI